MTDTTPQQSGAEQPESTAVARPRIRFGTIAWGLIVCAAAAGTLYVTGSAERRDDLVSWFAALTPGSLALVAVLAVGGVLLLLGLLAAIRRAQRQGEHPGAR